MKYTSKEILDQYLINMATYMNNVDIFGDGSFCVDLRSFIFKRAIIQGAYVPELNDTVKKWLPEITYTGIAEIPEDVGERCENDNVTKSIGFGDKSESSLFSYHEKKNDEALILNGNRYSRIILLGGIGEGKTTILKRIALYYATRLITTSSEDIILREIVYGYQLGLSRRFEYFPFFVDVSQHNCQSFSSLLIESYNRFGKKQINSIEDLFEIIPFGEDGCDIILLIDGFGRLTKDRKALFVEGIKAFLCDYPMTRVLLSMTNADLLIGNLGECFEDMKFRCRTLMPMSKDEGQILWLDLVSRANLLCEYAGRRYNKINPFRGKLIEICTPGDLINEFKNLAGSKLGHYLGREYDNAELMLQDKLGYKYHRDEYKDDLIFLGYIAYKMLIWKKQYIGHDDIDDLAKDFSDIRFYTNKYSFIENPKRIIYGLDCLFMSSGLIEKDKEYYRLKKNYLYLLFYLVSYACCNINAIFGDDGTNLVSYIDYLKTNYSYSICSKIIEFVIIELSKRDDPALKKVFEYIFDNADSIDIRHVGNAIVKFYGEYGVDYEGAKRAFSKIYSSPYLHIDYVSSLTPIASGGLAGRLYVKILNDLWRESRECNNDDKYLTAVGYMRYVSAALSKKDPMKYAQELFDSQQPEDGAALVIFVCMTLLEENDCSLEFRTSMVKSVRSVEKPLVEGIIEMVEANRSYIFVKALIDLSLTYQGMSIIRPLIKSEYALILIEEINSLSILHCENFEDLNRLQSTSEYAILRHTLNTLGSFPISEEFNDSRYSSDGIYRVLQYFVNCEETMPPVDGLMNIVASFITRNKNTEDDSKIKCIADIESYYNQKKTAGYNELTIRELRYKY